MGRAVTTAREGALLRTCGCPVSPRPATGERKQVTVLFTDVVGSMKLAAALDAERLREIMNELFNRAAAVVQRYQGTVGQFTGDGLMALFGAPLALEDHALRACIAALEIQSVTEKLAAEVLRRDGVALQLRVGLNSGEVVAGEIGSDHRTYTAVGHPVGMAQRMESTAPPGGVLCSLSTARLVEDATRLGSVEKRCCPRAPTRPYPHDSFSRWNLTGWCWAATKAGCWRRRETAQEVFGARRGCLVGVVGAPGWARVASMSEFTAIAASQGADIDVDFPCEAHTTTAGVPRCRACCAPCPR